MQQQISVITLGIVDIVRSKRFYVDGFGWKPVFETPEIVFYQMNGLVLGTWLGAALEDDMRRPLARPGAACSQCCDAARGPAAARPACGARRPAVAASRCAAAWRLSRLCRRSRRSRLGDRLQSGVANRGGRPGDVRAVGADIEPAGRVGTRPVLTVFAPPAGWRVPRSGSASFCSCAGRSASPRIDDNRAFPATVRRTRRHPRHCVSSWPAL